jgi:fumarate reductase subunit D
MLALTRRRYTRVYSLFFRMVAVFGYSVVVIVAMMYTTTMRVSDVAPALLPILAAFFAFSALLYNRARAYPDGPIQRRSLYAADEALTATILYLLGLMFGALITFGLADANFKVSKTPAFGDPQQTKLLILYIIPLFFVGLSFYSFAHALRIFCKNLTVQNYLRKRVRSMRKITK